jgi:hypothetical protein
MTAHHLGYRVDDTWRFKLWRDEQGYTWIIGRKMTADELEYLASNSG